MPNRNRSTRSTGGGVLRSRNETLVAGEGDSRSEEPLHLIAQTSDRSVAAHPVAETRSSYLPRVDTRARAARVGSSDSETSHDPRTRDSANGCSQRLEGGQLDDELV